VKFISLLRENPELRIIFENLVLNVLEKNEKIMTFGNLSITSISKNKKFLKKQKINIYSYKSVQIKISDLECFKISKIRQNNKSIVFFDFRDFLCFHGVLKNFQS